MQANDNYQHQLAADAVNLNGSMSRRHELLYPTVTGRATVYEAGRTQGFFMMAGFDYGRSLPNETDRGHVTEVMTILVQVQGYN
jgi:hypothetical protein